MSNNPNQPREFDVVLGGKAPPPVDGVVLGGIEGVKHRLNSTAAKERAAALIDALRYGEEGLDLLLKALKDPSEQVQLFAGLLLRDKGGEQGKQALLKHKPLLVFTTLDNWKFEPFYPNIGITASVCTAYSINLYRGQLSVRHGSATFDDFTLDEFQAFLKEPQVGEVEALACWMADEYMFGDNICKQLINSLCKEHKRLTNLKALFIGTRREHEYKKSRLYLSEISPVLEAFPNLQVLKLHGRFEGGGYFRPLQHSCLKTLIVETQDSVLLSQVCALNLPALEYLEVWGGNCVDKVTSILRSQTFPNLRYLGLPSFGCTDKLVEAIAQSPTHRLAVLDLHLGELTDKGAEILINSPITNHLHTLNIAKNYLSEEMTQRFSKLSCQVIVQPQRNQGDRYYALYE